MSVQLQTIHDTAAVEDEEGGENELIQTLPPADTGIEAWKFLFASFFIEAVLWGFPMTFGVFQEHYSKQEEFKDSPNVTIIGTVSTGIYFLGAPFASQLVRRFQHWQRHLVVAGWALCVASLVAASFMTTVGGLIATQGVLYGLGFTILYFPVLRMFDEWFVRRRGFAYGVLFGGGGVTGLGLPFALEALLSRFGYRVTLQASAVALFVLIAPVLPMIKGRLPTSSHHAYRTIDFSFLSQPLFYCFALSNLFHGFGFPIPSLYLPSFASALGLSGTIGALLLAVYNLATVFGYLCFGLLSDRVHNVLLLVFASTFVSSIAAFAVWGLAHSAAPLIIFALIYGLFGGSFAVFWSRFGSILSDDPQPVFSLMAFSKGVGNMAIGPIAAGLINQTTTSGYGIGRYQGLILFLGTTMFCSSLGVVGWRLKRPVTN